MQSSKQVKDLLINLKSIRLDFFWKNKNVCRFGGSKRSWKATPRLFFSPPFQTSTMQARNEHVKVNLKNLSGSEHKVSRGSLLLFTIVTFNASNAHLCQNSPFKLF